MQTTLEIQLTGRLILTLFDCVTLAVDIWLQKHSNKSYGNFQALWYM